jgi:hypothetical protein
MATGQRSRIAASNHRLTCSGLSDRVIVQVHTNTHAMYPQEQNTASTFYPEASSCTCGNVMVYGLALAGPTAHLDSTAWQPYGGKVMVYSRQRYGLSHTGRVLLLSPLAFGRRGKPSRPCVLAVAYGRENPCGRGAFARTEIVGRRWALGPNGAGQAK